MSRVAVIATKRNARIIGSVAIAAGIAVVWAIFTGAWDILGRAFAVALLLTVPGLAWSYAAFPAHVAIGSDDMDERGLDAIERATIAIVLSIVAVSGVVFALSRATALPPVGPKLAPRIFTGALLLVTVIPGAVAAWRMRRLHGAYAAAAIAAVSGGFAFHWFGAPVTFRALVLDGIGAFMVFGIAAIARRIWVRVVAAHPALVPFARYCTIGAGNTALDFLIYTTLTRGFVFWRTHFLWANACSFVIVVTWSFYWNRRWTFSGSGRAPRDAGTSGPGTVALQQYAKFFVATVVGLGIAESTLVVSTAFFHLPDLLAKVIAGPLVLIWNFTAYRTWAFGRRNRQVASPSNRVMPY